MTDNRKVSDRKFCFIKSKNGLVSCNLEIPTVKLWEGLTMGRAIMEEIDKGPVDIVDQGKVIGRVTGYKIVRKTLKYIEEYFAPVDRV